MLKCLNFNTSLSSCFAEITTKASNAFSSLTSQSVSVLEQATNIVSRTVHVAKSIPDYRTYSFEGAKYMRYANSLIPGALFVCSGISFAVYASKTDSRSQKIAAYLLAAATIGYGASQIVDYFDISRCIGQEIQTKFAKVQDPDTRFLPDSLNVEYDPSTQGPIYSAEKALNNGSIKTITGSSRCI